MDLLCPWNAPQYFLISDNLPSYLLYSHGIAFIFAILFGVIIFFQSRSIVNKIFTYILLAFSVWVFLDVVQWATNSPSVILFYWAVSVVFEFFIYLSAVYLCYTYITKKDLSSVKKLLLYIPLLPIIFLLPTKYLFSGVDITTCNVNETPFFIIYGYVLEIVAIFVIIILAIELLRKGIKKERKEIILFVSGIIIFLAAFSFGNVFGSLTDDWEKAQYGLFGMPIFIGFLMYLIVEFKSFSVKMFGVQVLVIAESVLIFSVLFSRNIENVRLIILITFLLVSGVGYLLIRSVRREIEQKEKLQHLTEKLEDANVKLQALDKLKSEFISLASHQLRSPLTVIKGYASTLTDGIVGDLTDKQKEVAQHIYVSATGLANVVEDFLNVTKIEQGGMKYVFAPTDMRTIVNDLVSDMRITAEAKHLEFQTDVHEGVFMANADATKMKQVFLNLIDNSIKYTKDGFVKVWLNKTGDHMRFGVSDSGVGVSEETKAKLFQKFGRGEGAVMNGGGSGLGLYLAQEIAEAHGGKITIDSEGLGKGSTFSVSLPLIK